MDLDETSGGLKSATPDFLGGDDAASKEEEAVSDAVTDGTIADGMVADGMIKANASVAQTGSSEKNLLEKESPMSVQGSASRSIAKKASEVGAEKVEPDNAGIPDEQFQRLMESLKGVVFNPTDSGNASLVIKQHGQRFRFCRELDVFYVWSGKCWHLDVNNQVGRWIKQTLESLPDEVVGQAFEIKKWMRKSLAKSHRTAIQELLKTDGPQVRIADVDGDAFLFNVANGTLDLKTGRLRDYDPDDLMTHLSPVLYNPNANCLLFQQAVLKICNNDPALVRYMQKVFGYALTGSNREQCLFLFIGKGANGKTLLLEILEKVLGTYFQHTRPSTFLRRDRSAMTNDIAKLRGARMVTASETNNETHWDEALLKAATGDGALSARFLRKEEFTFTPTFKIFLASNHEPRVSGTDDGIWRRFRMLKFKTRFWDGDNGESGPPELQADKTLSDKLQSELSGILNWALEGCLAWQSEGLQSPASVCDDTQAYRYESDVLAQFFEDKVEMSPAGRETKARFYEMFRDWAWENGQPVLSINDVGKSMKSKEIEESKSNGTRYWKGIRLFDSDEATTLSTEAGRSTSSRSTSSGSAPSPASRQQPPAPWATPLIQKGDANLDFEVANS